MKQIHSPSSEEVPSLEPFYQRFWCSQTNQRWRKEALAGAGVRRTGLNVPARGGVDGQYGHLGVAQGFDDLGEGFADLAAEAEAWPPLSIMWTRRASKREECVTGKGAGPGNAKTLTYRK